MALRLPNGTSADDRHAAWVRVVERIHSEQVNQGWRHQLFRLVRAVFTTNQRLSNDGGFLFNWMAENYLDASLMVVRRELDIQAGTENLRNLLEDIIEHPEVLTRARYVLQWGRGEVAEANRGFDVFHPVRVAGSSADDYIDPAAVRADLGRVVADGERLRTFAERTRAHRTPEQGIDTTITFRDLHQAIHDMRGIVEKYYLLLTLRTTLGWEPAAPYDTIEAFERPWVNDRAAVARAAEPEPTVQPGDRLRPEA